MTYGNCSDKVESGGDGRLSEAQDNEDKDRATLTEKKSKPIPTKEGAPC